MPSSALESFQRAELPEPEHVQDCRSQHVVSGQPRVLHSEQWVLQRTRRSQVGGDEPVCVAVLERLRHLRRGHQEESAQADQPDRRRRNSQPGQGNASKVAQGQDLEELDNAQSRNGQESEGKKPRIDRDQPLSMGNGERCNRQRAGTE
jgi:hypothetical protein